jgi:hypothetical protein
MHGDADDRDGGDSIGKGSKRTACTAAAPAKSLTGWEDEVLYLTKKVKSSATLPGPKARATAVSVGQADADTAAAAADPTNGTSVDRKEAVGRQLRIKSRFKKSSKLEPSAGDQRQKQDRGQDVPPAAAAAADDADAIRHLDTSAPAAPPPTAVNAVQVSSPQLQPSSQRARQVTEAAPVPDLPIAGLSTDPSISRKGEPEVPSFSKDSLEKGSPDSPEGDSGGSRGVGCRHEFTDYVPSSQLDPSVERAGEKEEHHDGKDDTTSCLMRQVALVAQPPQPQDLCEEPRNQTTSRGAPSSFSKLAQATGCVRGMTGEAGRLVAAATRAPQLPFLKGLGARGSTPRCRGNNSMVSCH